MGARAFDEDESGFTIVEMMVVMATIGVHSMMAIPTFLTDKERAMDRSAQSDLQVALSATKAVFTDDQDCTGLTIADFAAAEPNLRVGRRRNRLGACERLLRVDAGVELRRDQRGPALAVRDLLLPPHDRRAGHRPDRQVNVYEGRGVGTCSGNVVAVLPTVAAFFSGWQSP